MDERNSHVKENYVSKSDAAYYASLYRDNALSGGHVIILNPKNTPEYEMSKKQAMSALRAYPGGMHVGGGIDPDNAEEFLNAGASHVIVTSYVFKNGDVDMKALDEMVSAVGRSHLVLDLSARKQNDRFIIVTDRWQRYTSLELNIRTLNEFAGYCDEFLVHAVDVEGRSMGIDAEIVGMLSVVSACPSTYAGGVHTYDDIALIDMLGNGKVNFTVGSALDIFGGSMSFEELSSGFGGHV